MPMLKGMPKSRQRRTRKHSTSAQRRGRSTRKAERHLVATLRPGQSLEHLLTEEDEAALAAEVDAAARGDARAAWEHHMAGLIVEESLHRHRLRELADLGADAPGWMYSRWCVDQAYRWMLLNLDPRTDEMVRLVLVAAHLEHVEGIMDDPVAFPEYGTLVASCDWLVKQLCVYHSDGLRDFLDVRAEAGLVSRADRIEEWADAPLRVHRWEGRRSGILVVRDLVDDTNVELLDLGAFNEGVHGDHVLGRVVPISVPPYRMFDSRPVPVDRSTANHTAAAIRRGGDLGWLEAVAVAREERRLERGFSCRQQTLYATDLTVEPRADLTPPYEMPGRLRDLIESGLDEDVANGVVVAEVVLLAATVSPGAGSAVSPHLTAVLVDRRIREAVRDHCTSSEHETAWRTLAVSTTTPVKEWCLQLAERCRRAA